MADLRRVLALDEAARRYAAALRDLAAAADELAAAPADPRCWSALIASQAMWAHAVAELTDARAAHALRA